MPYRLCFRTDKRQIKMTKTELFRYLGEKHSFPKLSCLRINQGLVKGRIASLTPRGCSVVLDRDKLPTFFWFTEKAGENRNHIRNLKITK